MTKKYRMLSRTLMLLPAMVLLAVTTPAMADSIVVCPPHGGEFPDEPVIQDTDTQTTTRVHNQQTRAVAKRACIRCGDGIPEPGEQCDTGGQTTTCDADCTTVACGDGIVNTAAGELCDDGNEQSGDGCSSTCVMTLTPLRPIFALTAVQMRHAAIRFCVPHVIMRNVTQEARVRVATLTAQFLRAAMGS
jgi:cysteine-rich repeat protein